MTVSTANWYSVFISPNTPAYSELLRTIFDSNIDPNFDLNNSVAIQAAIVGYFTRKFKLTSECKYEQTLQRYILNGFVA
jgi:hypothetical protein